MKIKNKRYMIGMLLLIPTCLLMYVFAFTAEKIRVFYCVLEFLGLYDGYKFSTRNTIIWIGAIVLLVVLLIVVFKLINYELKKYRILEILPYLIICLNIVCCFFFPKINQHFLQFQHGLDSVIVHDRGTVSLFGFYSADKYGNQIPVLSLNFEGFVSENIIFYVKLVDIEDETKQYVFCNKNDNPQKIRMGELSNTWCIDIGHYKASKNGFSLDVEKIIPGYIDTPENRRLINYKVIIFNENESKTFYLYYDELH